MDRRSMLKSSSAASLVSLLSGHSLGAQSTADITPQTVYELRIYHAVEGKLPALVERFRSGTIRIFSRHDLHSVAYWVPTEDPLAGHTLIYILRHRSREAARENWAKFQADPEWQAFKAASEKDGPLTTKIDSTFMQLTDFSAKL